MPIEPSSPTRDPYDWLTSAKGEFPPPALWRLMAWTFLIVGLGFYALAGWLYFTNRFWWSLGSGFVGYMLRRQPRKIAPELLMRWVEELKAKGAFDDTTLGSAPPGPE